jgi:hypothetical protein
VAAALVIAFHDGASGFFFVSSTVLHEIAFKRPLFLVERETFHTPKSREHATGLEGTVGNGGWDCL